MAIAKQNKALDKGLNMSDKSYNTTPNMRQKKAFENVLENGGNLGKALVDAGYSETTSKRPKKVTETKGWKELLDKYIDDNLLQETLKNGLKAEYNDLPDHKTRHKYLETALKLKNKFPDKAGIDVNIVQITGINYVVPNGNNIETNT